MISTNEETKNLLEMCIRKHGTLIIASFCYIIEKEGYKIEPVKSNSIWDASVLITSLDDDDDSRIEFRFYNTFMEIFCVDRDEDPLVFNKKILNDEAYLMNAISHVLSGRIALVVDLLKGKSPSEFCEENPGAFERMRFLEKELEDD